MADVSFIRGTTSGISETPLVDGQLLVDTDKKDILLDVEDSSTHDVERLSMNSIPAGGAAGQVLKKASAADRDVVWGNAASGGGHTIVDGSGNDMADEDDLQFTGGLNVTDDRTNGRTVVSASGKMNKDGSNSDNVIFANDVTCGWSERAQIENATFHKVSFGGTGTISNVPLVQPAEQYDETVIINLPSLLNEIPRNLGQVAFNCSFAVQSTYGLMRYDGLLVIMRESTPSSDSVVIFLTSGDVQERFTVIDQLFLPTIALGDESMACGQGTIASATASRAGGQLSIASGVSSHAEGFSTVASGVSSHAEGIYSKTLINNYIHGSIATESILPYEFFYGSAVVYNNKIHILGSNISNNRTKHYSYDGTNWIEESTIPYEFYRGSAVVFNNKIHILGSGNSSNRTKHYSYDGTSWTEESTLPYMFYDGSAVVYNNKIHILGSSYNTSTRTKHYSYDGTSWTEESTLLYDFDNGSAIVYNNKIHILGSSGNTTKHHSYDGINWTSESTLPYNFYDGSAVVFNNKIHILGSIDSSSVYRKHYSYDGTSWTSESTLPYSFYQGSAVVFNNNIHILGSNGSSNNTKHYSLDVVYVETSTGAHAEGIGTIASGDVKHVQGKYNVDKYGTLFEIGNGTADNARSNIIDVYEDGNIALNNAEPDTYYFTITNTAASTAVAWCNKVAKFTADARASDNTAFSFSVLVKCVDGAKSSLALKKTPTITSISLYDAATSKQTVASANFTYTVESKPNGCVQLNFTIISSFVTSTVTTALNAVVDSVSPGFSCVYAASELSINGIVKGRGISDKFSGLGTQFNTLPYLNNVMQHVGDFYFPTGGPRWVLDLDVDPGTAYIAIAYLENTSTGAYHDHSISYVGVPSITLASTAPAPPAGKVITFVGTTWTPFAAGTAGAISNGVLTDKPKIKILGFHSSNTPTAGLGMHLRLFRIY